MIKFEEIHSTVSVELKMLNEKISEALKSESPLMQKIVDDSLKTKGKQIRPILVLLTSKLFGAVNEAVLNAGASIELLHNASLIHDDVIDESKERRGKPTINRVWDNHVAVLVGDFFVSSALNCAIKTRELKVIDALSNLSRRLSLGEINQIDNAHNHLINEASYYDTISHKTASLFRGCVEVGGYVVNAPDDKLDLIRRYAELLGLCFQIKDDIFDYFNDPIIGKPTGNDLREGKITLPLIYALTKEGAEGQAEMIELVKKSVLSTEEIDVLIDYAKKQGGIEYAEEAMLRLREEAFATLAPFGDNDSIAAFKALFNYIIERNK